MVIKGEVNLIVHFGWDNFNKITSNNLGSNFVNTTAGIIIQEIILDINIGSACILPVYDRSTYNLEKVVPGTLPSVHLQNKIGL